jgi:2-polyprenyl-3-methyl-5-hydroxy-6-metoxy-1,4-benzoquinol methylase
MFRCASAETLHDDPSKWDAIVLADVLEHLEDPHAVLSSCNQLLAPGGQVLVAVPNGRGPFELESALARWQRVWATLLWLTDLVVAVLNK